MPFSGTAGPSSFIHEFRAFELIIVRFFQSIDTLRSLYENQVPVRFGVILYSTQLIKNIEDNGGQIKSYDAETNAQVKEDISTMVFTSL